MDNLPMFYNLDALKGNFSDGTHFVAIGFSTPFCLHLPNDNYSVRIKEQSISKIAQIILEKKRRHQDKTLQGQQELLNYADKHGTNWYTSALIYLPIRHSNPKVNNSVDEMVKITKQHHQHYHKEAINVFNYLINSYRLCTGECHISPLQGRNSSLTDYSIALIFNDLPSKKPTVHILPIRVISNWLPVEPAFPPTTIEAIQNSLDSGTKINLVDDLLLNAYNLFDQGNNRLAIIEAETAFEVALRQQLRNHLLNRGRKEAVRQVDRINSFTDFLINKHFKS